MQNKVAPGRSRTYLAVFLLCITALPISTFAQAPILRRFESASRGFLVIRNQDGATVGSGESVEVAHKGRISSRLTFRFKDCSIDEETTEYSQDRSFHLISDHHVQRGPSFPHPIDASIDMASQQVTTIADGKAGEPPDTRTEHMDLPENLSNGLVLTLLKNLQNDGKQTEFPYVAFSPKGRLVKLAISNVDQRPFRVGGHAFRADHYIIRIELGGIAGVVAPIIGKQPSDIEVWVASGKVPAVVRVDGALYVGGPVLSIQLASPTW